jgi:integrase
MGRPTQGWKLRRHGRIYAVRFTAHNRRYEISTGESDAGRAGQAAALIYARTLQQRGAARAKRGRLGETDLGKAAEEWLNSSLGIYDETTIATYAGFFRASIGPYFGNVSKLTARNIETWIRQRLKQVSRESVRKELNAIRALLRFLTNETPELPKIPRGAMGTRHKRARKAKAAELSPAEVRKLLAALPERSKHGLPIRARYILAYETSLRPAALDGITAPEHYHRGARYLIIPEELDKARAGRPIPLTAAARKALDAVCPESGLIFGKHKYHKHLVETAKRVLGKRVSPYDLRHARITHWLEESGNMPGTQYLAGHALVSTTAKYAHPSLRAAEAVLGKKRTVLPVTKRKRA